MRSFFRLFLPQLLVLLHERPAQHQSMTVNTIQSNFSSRDSCLWYHRTAASKCHIENSGHSTDTNSKTEWLLCHRRKSLRRISPEVLMTRSGSLLFRLYSAWLRDFSVTSSGDRRPS
uniref:Putative secreted protein n=1 Tax=Ixodes ricinus TaxID=34613 RepID=A0A6B0UM17_IXORI